MVHIFTDGQLVGYGLHEMCLTLMQPYVVACISAISKKRRSSCSNLLHSQLSSLDTGLLLSSPAYIPCTWAVKTARVSNDDKIADRLLFCDAPALHSRLVYRTVVEAKCATAPPCHLNTILPPPVSQKSISVAWNCPRRILP
jgi:hypothetical protein